MTTSVLMVAGFACAQFGPPANPVPENLARAVGKPAESRIAAVTIYQGQALVTRDVSVPAGEGTVELVVSPLPSQAVDSSLYAEGTDGLRVLSARTRTHAVKDDTRGEVRAKEEQIKKLQAEAKRFQKQLSVQEHDVQYLQKLEGFTGTSLNALTEKGRLDSEAVVELSAFIMEGRATRAKAETELAEQLQANAEAIEFAHRQLADLALGSSRTERDAVVVVQRVKPEAGTVRLGYLVGSASWEPRYRLRGTADNAPVRLEYLAAVTQLSGEDWTNAKVTLSTARPSLDAAPPDLLPLKMTVNGLARAEPIEANDERSQRIVAELEKTLTLSFPSPTPLDDIIKFIRGHTKTTAFPDGIPIYLDPILLQEAEKTPASNVTMNLDQVPLKTSLRLLLSQVGLDYRVANGVLLIVSAGSDTPLSDLGMVPRSVPEDDPMPRPDAILNHEAASGQAAELRVSDAPDAAPSMSENDAPSVTFAIAGRLDIPSRRDPQLLEVARVELPAEYYAKAVPVLTPRVYRLAKLTNKSDLVLLPGEAMVYVGGDFVGRMRLPLVATGEPFVAGFGVDTQIQASRRLLSKVRTVQGGNQIFTYEFRIGLRNYRPGPVKVQLWDRLPRGADESVSVKLVKSSAELSTDPLYLRTARMDNLLRWDIDVPPGTIGEKTLYLNYEFRLEYARDLPQPRFDSGGLREAPIGGGAMGGGMGGMGGGGFR